VKGKVLVSATKASNEMVFKGANGTFGSIAAMHMWQDQLEIHILSCQNKLRACDASFSNAEVWGIVLLHKVRCVQFDKPPRWIQSGGWGVV